MSAASADTRALTVPSSSPSRNVPRLPRRMTPGSSTSAPKLTTASTTRSGPSAAASTCAVSPFWSETANPSPISRPASSAAAARV